MQTRTVSLIESCLSTAIGFGVALLTQVIAFPWFGIAVNLETNLYIAMIFTVVSIARGYLVRRLFNWLEAINDI